MRHGGKLLIDHLVAEGVRHVFEVPGESFLAALDGLYDCPEIKTIVCRHEGGAAMMAEAMGKLTGRPGICFATRGPGAANALSGVYVAHMDATPMILFVGMPQRRLEDQTPFQDLEVEALFRPVSKWAAVINDTDRIPEYVARAFHIALSDRPGPVVLGLPEDVLSAATSAPDVRPVAAPRAAPSPAHMTALLARLETAKRPMLLVGGPGWSHDVQQSVQRFAEAFDLPVASAFRCQDYIDNRHACYVGHSGFGTDPTLKAALSSADVILAIGAELGDITTGGYTLIEAPNPAQYLVHVHPSAAWAGGVIRADLSIVATADGFAEAIDALPRRNAPVERAWSDMRKGLRAAYLASREPKGVPGAVGMDHVVRIVSDVLGDAGLTTNGAGNYSMFVHRYFEFRRYRSGLAPICGSMGYGVPAAIAAKLLGPERPVVAFAGDGCFQMTGCEIGTAVQYGLPMVIIVANNGIYGTIRMHQERRYPGRVAGTSLVNPDFAALAHSFGGAGETVRQTGEFEPALRRGLASEVPYVIELQLDPEAISPLETIASVRAAGHKR